MACSNCFNGCTEIISDQCVRYTGPDIPLLGIDNGDTLASVEASLVSFISNLYDGSGLVPTIAPETLCELISQYLPPSGTISLNNIISAIFQSICNLDTQVSGIKDELDALNADYTTGCLEGVTPSSNTHDILQAAIDKLCSIDSAFVAFVLDVTTNYVKIEDLNTLIQAYLDSISPSNLQKNKMVPYIAYEYYGPLSNFDINGAGTGEWVDVYLCNGNNGTPDKRGRVAVGVTDGTMGGGAMSSVVNPATPGNPVYTLAGTNGQNNVTLNLNQIPTHSHTATATSISEPHSHFTTAPGTTGFTLNSTSPVVQQRSYGNNDSYNLSSGSATASLGPTSNSTVSVSTSVAINSVGGGLPHTNVQPSIGAYFIMYIP